MTKEMDGQMSLFELWSWELGKPVRSYTLDNADQEIQDEHADEQCATMGCRCIDCRPRRDPA